MLPTLKAAHRRGSASRRARAGQLFFLYLPLNSPHLPVVPSAAFAGEIGRRRLRRFRDGDGRLRAGSSGLRQAGTLDNTLLVFTSDNGGL